MRIDSVKLPQFQGNLTALKDTVEFIQQKSQRQLQDDVYIPRTLTADDKQLWNESRLIQQLITNPQNTLIIGSTGSGKTLLMEKVEYELQRQGKKTFFMRAFFPAMDLADINTQLLQLGRNERLYIFTGELGTPNGSPQAIETLHNFLKEQNDRRLVLIGGAFQDPRHSSASLLDPPQRGDKDYRPLFRETFARSSRLTLQPLNKEQTLQGYLSALKISGFGFKPIIQNQLLSTLRSKLPQIPAANTIRELVQETATCLEKASRALTNSTTRMDWLSINDLMRVLPAEKESRLLPGVFKI